MTATSPARAAAPAAGMRSGTNVEDRRVTVLVDNPVADPGDVREEVLPTSDEPDLAGGVTWSFVSLAGKQAGRLAFSLLLARLLGPRSYGIVGQATIYILLTRFIVDQGLATALVQKKRLTDRDVGTVVLLNAAAVAVLVGATIGLALPLARFLDTPELTAVLQVLALDVVLLGVAVVPTALLTRQLRFRTLAGAEISSTVVGGLGAVAVALAGGGYWSLVVFTLLTDAVYLVVVLVAEPPRHVRGSVASLRALWGFSLRVMGAQVLYHVARNADNMFIAKALGAAALGLYALAYRILLLPQQMLGQVINRVTLPVFSRAQDDPARVHRVFLDVTAALALLTFPCFALVLVAAPDLVPLVFGPRWGSAVQSMQILAIAGLTMTPAHLARPLLFAHGAAGTVFRVQVAATAASLGGFALGVHWDIEGVAVAVVAVNLVFGPLLLCLACRRTGLPGATYLRRLVPAAASSAAVCATYVVVSALAGDHWTSTIGAALAAAVAYGVVLQVGWPQDASFTWGLCRRLVLRRSAAVPASG